MYHGVRSWSKTPPVIHVTPHYKGRKLYSCRKSLVTRHSQCLFPCTHIIVNNGSSCISPRIRLATSRPRHFLSNWSKLFRLFSWHHIKLDKGLFWKSNPGFQIKVPQCTSTCYILWPVNMSGKTTGWLVNSLTSPDIVHWMAVILSPASHWWFYYCLLLWKYSYTR